VVGDQAKLRQRFATTPELFVYCGWGSGCQGDLLLSTKIAKSLIDLGAKLLEPWFVYLIFLIVD
jgi:hypothetical protein